MKLILEIKCDKYPQGIRMSYIALERAIERLKEVSKNSLNKKNKTISERDIFVIINGLSPLLSIFEDIKKPSQFSFVLLEIDEKKYPWL